MEVKKVITKRICELTPGEKFMMMGGKYSVVKITDAIYFYGVDGANHTLQSFGLKNKAKVEIIPLAEKPDSNPS